MSSASKYNKNTYYPHDLEGKNTNLVDKSLNTVDSLNHLENALTNLEVVYQYMQRNLPQDYNRRIQRPMTQLGTTKGLVTKYQALKQSPMFFGTRSYFN